VRHEERGLCPAGMDQVTQLAIIGFDIALAGGDMLALEPISLYTSHASSIRRA
jgi:hypothetical protein